MNTLLESYRNRMGQYYLADQSEMISELLGYLQHYDSAVIPLAGLFAGSDNQGQQRQTNIGYRFAA